MPISSYPRVTVQGTGTAQNTQNGSALMVVNPSTGQYEAATAATFGGGGGGDATAANQATQISLATSLNSYNFIFGKGTAEYLNDQGFVLLDIKNLLTDIKTLETDIKTLLTDIKNNQTTSVQTTQIVDASGNSVNVTNNKLNVDTA
jgi:hypothetical protein